MMDKMMDKQSLVIDLLSNRMKDSKVGILAKGIGNIQPAEIATALSAYKKSHIYILQRLDIAFQQMLKKQIIH